ncbi:MAG TPA: hypothetical protein VGR08_13125, partial [Thermomicrobiales bacterium]|nr:hypothetical protein [Thermomicrobiales bacterium]
MSYVRELVNVSVALRILLISVFLVTGSVTGLAQDDATPEPAGIDEVQPAPASIGADVPSTYFGPAPSEVD